jgi:undecaprenyl-diphosphatase
LTLLEAFALGALQGATEFLPVSSSGHLVLAKHLVSAEALGGSVLIFDLVVHLGTLGAIVLVLRERIGRLVRAGFSLLPGGPEAAATDRRWIGLLLLGSVPTALIGLALRDPVEAMHERVVWVGAALLLTALLLAISERLGRRERGASSLRWADALWIGTVQGFAVIPGISRSGSTVAAALVRDVDGETSVEFSMLLSLPAIAGASFLEFLRAGPAQLVAGIAPLLIGFVTAFAIGIAALKLLQWIVVRRKLMPFAVYCAILGLGVIGLG